MIDYHANSENVDRLEYRFDYSADDGEEASEYLDTLSKAAPPPAPTGWTLWQVVGTVVLLRVVPLLLVFGQVGSIASLGAAAGVGFKYVLVTLASLALVMSCLALFFVWRMRRLIRRSAEQTESEPNRWLCAISAAGFTVGCAPTQVIDPWSAITRVVFTPKLILFHFGVTNFKMLPTRVLLTPAELIRFSVCLRKWYSGPVVDGEGTSISAESIAQLTSDREHSTWR